MSAANSTSSKNEPLAEHPHMPHLLSQLRSIRRANAGIGACATILNEHSTNQDCTPATPGVYIQLTPDDAASLVYAVETCSRFIGEALEDLHVFGDVMWDDEYLPDVRRQADLRQQMQDRKIPYQEFERRVRNL